MGDRRTNITLNVQTNGLTETLRGMIDLENRIAAIAESYKVTTAEAKKMIDEEGRAIQEASRINEEAARKRASTKKQLQDQSIREFMRNLSDEVQADRNASNETLKYETARNYQRRRNLEELGNATIKAAQARASAELNANQEKTKSDMQYQRFAAERLRERVEMETNANNKMNRLHELALIENQKWENNRVLQHAKALRENARMDAQSANPQDPFLKVHGFAGLASGGGFGGLTFTGAGAPLAAGAIAAMSWGRKEADQARESDFAVHRMMTLVNEAERSSGNSFTVMRDRATDLARTLGITIPEAADAMREALTNAIPPEMAELFVKGANQLSMMEGIDVKSTIGSMAAINILFAAMDKGNVKMRDLANQIGQLAGVADTAHVSFKEMMAVLATATLKGMSGDIAATAARNLFTKIDAPTEKVRAEQERVLAAAGMGHGKTFADLVEESGFVEGILQMDKALKEFGSTRAKTFGADFRSKKLYDLILGDEGAGMKSALEDQINAIKEHRAAGGAAELLDTEAKQFAMYKERLSQAGQEFGKVVSKIELFFTKTFADMVPTFSGQKSKTGRDLEALERDRAITSFPGSGSGENSMANAYAQYLDAKEKEHGRKFSTKQEVTDYEENELPFIQANLKTGAMPPKEASEARAADLAKTTLAAAEAKKKADEEEAKHNNDMRGETEHIIKEVGKLKTKYEELGNTTLSGLHSEFEHAYNLSEKLFGSIKKNKEALQEQQLKASEAQAGRMILSPGGTLFSAMRRGSGASRLIEGEHAEKDAGRASSAFGGMDDSQLLQVGKTGVIPFKDVERYIDLKIKRSGATGLDASKSRREFYKEADDAATEIRSAYLDFKSEAKEFGYQENDFGKYFKDKKLTQVEGKLTGAKATELSTNENRLAESRQLMDDIKAAYKTQKEYAEAIAAAFDKTGKSSEAFGDNLAAGLAFVKFTQMLITGVHGFQEAGQTAKDFKPRFKAIAAEQGFSGPEGFQNVDSPKGGVKSMTVNNNQKIDIHASQGPGEGTVEFAKRLVQMVQEASDRGSATPDEHK